MIAVPVVVLVPLKLIVALGFVPSCILVLAYVPPFVPSHNLAYTISP